MARNLKYQFKNAIEKNFKEGMSKHSLKNEHAQRGDKVFSYSDRKNLIDVAANFSNFMRENYKEIKMIRDIRQEHVQSFLNLKAKTCSDQTLKQYASKFQKLEKLAAKTFDTRIKFSGYITPKSEIRNHYRDVSMSKNDLNKIREGFSNSTSKAKIAIELSARNGLRVSECTKLTARNINLGKMQIEVRGAKGGRDRDIPIREKDREFYENLKSQYHDDERVCPIQKDSINKALREQMNRYNISEKYENTGIHSIRKFYAQERFDELRNGNEELDIKDAWGIVSQELGHSYDRMDLLEVYVRSVY